MIYDRPSFNQQTRCGKPGDASLSVDSLLAAEDFWESNAQFQRNMDINRHILKQELELEECDIVDVPQLFLGVDPCWTPASPPTDGRTVSFYPNMVNHLVLGNVSIVPKPYGPQVDGNDVFEAYLESRLPDRKLTFIGEWNTYFVHFGDIHCATNTRRKPFDNVNWWECKPETAFDV